MRKTGAIPFQLVRVCRRAILTTVCAWPQGVAASDKHGILALATSYDRVAYPSAIFTQTHPDRLAVLARLAGLDAPPPERARILEVGGGDCMNLLALAAIWPDCAAQGFDLSEAAIERGARIAGHSGLGNVALAVGDILEARAHYPARSFDYVIVHGVYAWVPPEVRRAIMPLIGHVLSDRGVAFVSYNAMPGGHVRQILREMLLHELGGIDDPEVMLAEARTFLEGYARPQPDDSSLETTLREQARSMFERPDSVLFHDELGDCFFPQRLGDVAADAAQSGLRLLTDAGRNRHLDGFLPDGSADVADPDAAVLDAAISDDYRALRFFRQSLLVRAECAPDRRIDSRRIAPLFLSTRIRRQEDGSFASGSDALDIADEALAAALERAAALAPQRVPVAEIARTEEQLRVVLDLFNGWYVNLHPDPAPFVSHPGDRPTVSPLVRGLIAMGERAICTLDHRRLAIDQPELRALLRMADGTRTLADLASGDHGIPPDEVAGALGLAAARALLIA